MQTTHHAGKIAAIQQSFVPRIVASHLLLTRKQVSPSFTSPAHLVVRQKKSKLLLDSLHAWWRKMPRYPKIQTGRMVQLCTESVGRTLLLQCWRSGGGRHNAAEKALCAICLGNKNSYDLCQILSPKRPYAAPGASLYRGLKNLKQSDCILDFTNSYSGILAPWRFTQWAGLFLYAGIGAFWPPEFFYEDHSFRVWLLQGLILLLLTEWWLGSKCNIPHKSSQLTSHRRNGYLWFFPFCCQTSVTRTQSLLSFPCNIFGILCYRIRSVIYKPCTNFCRCTIRPGGFVKQTSQFAVSNFCYSPGTNAVSTGIFPWNQSQKSHELFGTGKSWKITQFSNQGYCG